MFVDRLNMPIFSRKQISVAISVAKEQCIGKSKVFFEMNKMAVDIPYTDSKVLMSITHTDCLLAWI